MAEVVEDTCCVHDLVVRGYEGHWTGTVRLAGEDEYGAMAGIAQTKEVPFKWMARLLVRVCHQEVCQCFR